MQIMLNKIMLHSNKFLTINNFYANLKFITIFGETFLLILKSLVALSQIPNICRNFVSKSFYQV